MKEKRRFERKSVIAGVNIKPAKKDAPLFGQAFNINMRGVGVYLGRELAPGEKVLVNISFLNDGEFKTTEYMAGTIRWVNPVGKKYEAGLRFDDGINKKDFRMLSKCLGC